MTTLDKSSAAAAMAAAAAALPGHIQLPPNLSNKPPVGLLLNQPRVAAAPASSPASTQQLPMQTLPCAKLLPTTGGESKKQEAFCIRWKGFQGNIIESLGGVRSDEDFTDVTLSCDSVRQGSTSSSSSSSSSSGSGVGVQAHKLILASCSNYFRRILRDTPCQHPVIILSDIEPVVLDALLAYMYRGEVFVSEDILPAFFAAAQSLEIKGIAETPSPTTDLFGSGSKLAGFPFPSTAVLPTSPSSTISSTTTTSSAPSAVAAAAAAAALSSSLHPVGDLTLLAAAATASQQQRSTSGGGGGGGGDSISISKRRKTTPRRLEVVKDYKVPRVSAEPQQNGDSSDDNHPSPPVAPRSLPTDISSAMNLSTRQINDSKSAYVSKGSLLNIPNPSINFFGKPVISDTAVNMASSNGGKQLDLPSSPVALDMSSSRTTLTSTVSPPPPIDVLTGGLARRARNASSATSPSTDAENASPNLVEVKTEENKIIPLLPGLQTAKTIESSIRGGDAVDGGIGVGIGGGGGGDAGSEDAGSPTKLLAPVSSSTTPEQMAALLGPSWKSRQPRMCQYCERMFSNKFNLKQVR